MRVLIFHGYLLRGTGSNVYNAELAAALRAPRATRSICSARTATRWRCRGSTPSATGTGGELEVEVRARAGARDRLPAGHRRRCCRCTSPTATRAFEARPFPELLATPRSPRTSTRNVAAVRAVAARARPDVALANHLVMGPAILARALAGTCPYAVKIHGSALEYVVKPHPERFLPYAREGLARARGVLVGSLHTAESLWDALDDPELHDADAARARPGVDVEQLRARASRDEARRGRWRRSREPARSATGEDAGGRRDAFAARRRRRRRRALARLEPGRDRLVAFVGKLIVSKGVDLLLGRLAARAAPRRPDARLVVVGFGAYRDGLEALAARARGAATSTPPATSRGAGRAPRAARRRAAPSRGVPRLGGGGARGLPAARARGSTTASSGAGRLDHAELARRCCPPARRRSCRARSPRRSAWSPPRPRRAARCRSSPAHSGLAEVTRDARGGGPATTCAAVAVVRRRAAAPSTSSPTGSTAGCGRRSDLRAATREALVATARERFSWEGVAARGDRRGLGPAGRPPLPPEHGPFGSPNCRRLG